MRVDRHGSVEVRFLSDTDPRDTFPKFMFIDGRFWRVSGTSIHGERCQVSGRQVDDPDVYETFLFTLPVRDLAVGSAAQKADTP